MVFHILVVGILDLNKERILKMEQSDDIIFVMLPTYNRGSTCVGVIRNVLDQNITNWFLYVVDDGSREGESKIITTFIESLNSPKIEYVKNEQNLKLPRTINRGMDKFIEGNYNYFTWISDDNIYRPNFLSNLYNLRADFAHSAWNFGPATWQTEYKTYDDIRRHFGGLASFMWSRRAISLIGKYNPEYTLVCDLEYLYRTYKTLDNKKEETKKEEGKEYSVKYSPRSEMIYILHPGADSVKYERELKRQDTQLKQKFL